MSEQANLFEEAADDNGKGGNDGNGGETLTLASFAERAYLQRDVLQ